MICNNLNPSPIYLWRLLAETSLFVTDKFHFVICPKHCILCLIFLFLMSWIGSWDMPWCVIYFLQHWIYASLRLILRKVYLIKWKKLKVYDCQNCIKFTRRLAKIVRKTNEAVKIISTETLTQMSQLMYTTVYITIEEMK